MQDLIKIISGIIFAFICTLTLGNTPYPLLGYGLSAFALFLIGYFYTVRNAIISFTIGTILALALLLYTDSIFTLVAVAAAIIRPLQMVVLVLLKRSRGLLASTLVSVLFGSFVASILGISYYGEGALSTALAFFDVIFAVPAFIAYRFSKMEGNIRLLMLFSSIASAFLLFFSISTFLILVPFILALVFLVLSLFMVYSPSTKSFGKSKEARPLAIAGFLLIIIGFSLFLMDPTSSYVVRSTYYSLYPDSLTKSQWIQKETSDICMQGNLAGDWTVERGVWDPRRLRVLDTCIIVTGTIVGIFPQQGPGTDNDFLIDIKLDPEYEYLLSIGSFWLRGGHLHVEVVPRDHHILQGLELKPGMRVKVIGAWVLDTDHGWWSESHPTWYIEILSKS